MRDDAGRADQYEEATHQKRWIVGAAEGIHRARGVLEFLGTAVHRALVIDAQNEAV